MLIIVTVVVFMALLSIVIKFCLFNCKSGTGEKSVRNSINLNDNMETKQLVDVKTEQNVNQSVKILVHKPRSWPHIYNIMICIFQKIYIYKSIHIKCTIYSIKEYVCSYISNRANFVIKWQLKLMHEYTCMYILYSPKWNMVLYNGLLKCKVKY